MRWLRKLVNQEMLGRYLDGENLVHGFAVDSGSLGLNETSGEIFKALFMERPVDDAAVVDEVATLLFPLYPTDTAVPAMGGNTPEQLAITGGDFLQPVPFDGRGMVRLPADPIATHLYVEPTMLRAGAFLLKHTPKGGYTEMAAYFGPRLGWGVPDGSPVQGGIPRIGPNPLFGPHLQVKGETGLRPADLDVGEDGSLQGAYVLERQDDDVKGTQISLEDVSEAGFLRARTTWNGLPVLLVGKVTGETAGFRALCLSHDAYDAQAAGFRMVEAGVYEAVIPASQIGQPTFTLSTPPSWPHN